MHGEKRESETESKSCLFIEILLGRDMFGPTSNMGQCNISSIIMSIVMILTMLERCNRSDQQEEFLAPQGALHANFFRFSLGPAPVSQQICIYSIWSSWRNHLQSMPMYQNSHSGLVLQYQWKIYEQRGFARQDEMRLVLTAQWRVM